MKKIAVCLLVGAFLVLGGIAWAGTVTLRPNADGASVTFNVVYPASPTTHYDKCDEEVADDDSTYVETDDNSDRDLYDLTASGLQSGQIVINSVSVYVRHKRFDATNWKDRITIRTNAANYDSGTDIELTSSYVNSSYSWATNPNTGVNWTVAELDALQAGALSAAAAGGARMTQVWVVVTYSAVGAGGAAMMILQ